MKLLTVLATFKAKQDKIDDLKHALSSLIEPTLGEDGCIQYELHQDLENPENFFMFENWASKAHLDVHLQSKHIQHFRSIVSDLLEAPASITLANKI